jgi:replicative DNA helicase
VEDLWNLAQTLNPDHIIVDGAYLLSHPNPRLNRFDRVAENSRLLKSAVATNLGVPATCSWQFNREAAKKAKAKKGGDKGDLEDIGFADEIGQLSSLVLGLYQPDSVETLHQRQIQIIKGRNGECSGFNINWDFRTMDFSEVQQQSIQELNYI